MASNLRIVLGGGSGFIGKRLRTQLQNRGHEVIVVSRKSANGNLTWDEISQRGLPDDCHAVVNLAGENLMNPLRRWNAEFKADLESSRIGTTRQLTKAINSMKIKPKVFISTSAIGYYPASTTTEYTEEYEGGHVDYMSQLCTDWEAAAHGAGVRQATVRVGLVLGREGGMIQNMYIPFYLGAGGRIGSGQQWMSWVHVDDVAGIYTHIIENEQASGIFNATSPNCVTNSEFTQAFASAMWRPAFLPVPQFMLRFVFGAERAKVMAEGQKVIPKRTLESGYKFKYADLKEALDDIVN